MEIPPAVKARWFRTAILSKKTSTEAADHQQRQQQQQMNDSSEAASGRTNNPSPDWTQAKLIVAQRRQHNIFPISSTQWIEFSTDEMADLEAAYVAIHPSTSGTSGISPALSQAKEAAAVASGKVAVGEDDMFEVDIVNRIIYPIYWEGPIANVVRATWFACESSGKLCPLDEVLTGQIEDGYLKFTPWKVFPPEDSFIMTSSAATSPLTNTVSQIGDVDQDDFLDSLVEASNVSTMGSSTDASGQGSGGGGQKVQNSKGYTVETVINPAVSGSSPAASVEESVQTQQQNQQAKKYKWSLFGPYSSNYVIYTGRNTAWLMSENVTAKLTQAIYSRISSGENLGGIRIVRGHENAVKYAQNRKKSTTATSDKAAAPTSGPASEESKKSGEVGDTFTLRRHSRKKAIKHLIFATHGIGQKLGEKSLAVNFIQDINNLRNTLKSNYVHVLKQQQQSSETKQSSSETSNSGGGESVEECSLMVLPVEWRRKISFDRFRTEGELSPLDDHSLPSIDEISLDTVPGLRAIISDVLLDVLLYMEPSHKFDMISSLIGEMNRVYRLFVRNHPDFLKDGGQVHLYAHSLGSLICLDAVSHHSLHKSDLLMSKPPLRDSTVIETSPVDLTDLSASPPQTASSIRMSDATSMANQNRVKPLVIKGRSRRSSSNPTGPLDSHVKPSRSEDIPNLEFKVSGYFALGSPLGLFLRIKEKRLGMTMHMMIKFYAETILGISLPTTPDPFASMSAEHVDSAREWLKGIERSDNTLHPDVDKMFHMFHPSDVISYRLEPLIARSLASRKPEPIQSKGSTSSSRTLSLPLPTFRWAESWMGYAIGSLTGIQMSAPSTSATGNVSNQDQQQQQQQYNHHHQRRGSDTVSPITASMDRSNHKGGDPTLSASGTSKRSVTAPTSPIKSQASFSAIPLKPRMRPDEILATYNRHQRLDFTLQERILESQYFSALQVHFGYWTNEDIGYFVASEILSTQQPSSSSQSESKLKIDK